MSSVKLISLIVFFVAFSNTALADFKKGLSAHRNGDYDEAYTQYKLVSDKDARAQHYIGILYATGNGVSKNEKLAYDWFLKAAKNNYTPSQYNIGMAYFRQKYDFKDKPKAIYWLDKAAKNGHPSAQLNLGNIYLEGKITTKDEDKARDLLEKVLSNPRSKSQTKKNAKRSLDSLWQQL